VLREARRFAEGMSLPPTFELALPNTHWHAQVAAAIVPRPSAAGSKARAREELVRLAAEDGPKPLTAAHRHRLLSDTQAWAEVRSRVLAHRAHPDWWLPATRPAGAAPTPAAAPSAQPGYMPL